MVPPPLRQPLEAPAAATGLRLRRVSRPLGRPPLPPKVGTRFSKETARVLRQWLDTHKDHPFPNSRRGSLTRVGDGGCQRAPRHLHRNPPGRGHLSPSAAGYAHTDNLTGAKRRSTWIRWERWVDSPSGGGAGSCQGHRARNGVRKSGISATWLQLRRLGKPELIHEQVRQLSWIRQLQEKTTRGRPDGLDEDELVATLTRYDWSRHEKSLHVPIERWLCSPHGPVEVSPSTGESCCVFCGQSEPTTEHLATHNPDTCKQKIFNRKDHLKQHLRLVHDVAGVAWVIEAWKAPSLKIRSRCGFCSITLETWPDREAHLADHFKLGHTMADWAGDWGFEEHIMSTVESYMPPYVIDYDRRSPFPFMASGQAPSSPRSAYELLSLELAFFLHRHFDQSKDIPSNQDLRLQACRVIFASEALTADADSGGEDATSWLRDLITFDDEVARQARFGPLLSQAERRLAILRINGKNTLFEACPLEKRLRDYVESVWEAQALVPEDSDLQVEAYRIIISAEEQFETMTPDFITNWFIKMVMTSTGWLGLFKRRRIMPMAALQPSQPLPSSATQPTAPMDMIGLSGQGQTDSTFGIDHFMDQLNTAEPALGTENLHESMPFPGLGVPLWVAAKASKTGHDSTHDFSPTLTLQDGRLDFGFYVLNDANYHRWFDVELKRWATATMSAENPAGHIPSDGEIQHQARLLLYDDGDPWNTTAADNPEWLDRFKRDIGILPLKPAEELGRLNSNDERFFKYPRFRQPFSSTRANYQAASVTIITMNATEGKVKFGPKQAFNSTSQLYDELVSDSMENLAKESLGLIPPIKNGAVFHDNGCGTGAGTAALMSVLDKESVTNIVLKGTDINEDAIQFDENTFTHAIGNALLFVLANDGVDAVKETYRTLQSGGVAIFNSWGYVTNLIPLHVAAQATRPEGTPLPRAGLEKWSQPEFLRDVIERGGFAPEKIEIKQLHRRDDCCWLVDVGRR
ncbi:hypothetical protein HJFPF1_07200 [Paramyrothecium foliicola]|nr:hypothetical protein HJFPF1_07200 [Paramyrothecium foliicola]